MVKTMENVRRGIFGGLTFFLVGSSWFWASLACWGSESQGAPAIEVKAVPSTVRVGLSGPVDGTDRVKISCAKNEVESFQVVLTALNGKLKKVDASLSGLTDDAGNNLPPECVEIFSEILVPIRMPDPRSTLSPGLWPDPLVPFVDPYTGEPVRGAQWGEEGFTGERFRGKEFDVWPNQHRTLWIDVSVPKDVLPGTYEGTLKVWAENASPVEAIVTVEIWDFALPDGPTLESHFGGFERLAIYHGLALDSEEFHRLEDRYIAMLADHRINPPLPRRFHPPARDDGSVLFGYDLDKRISSFVAEHHVTNFQVPRAPFDHDTEKDRAKMAVFYRSWIDYLKSRRWADRAYLYMYDEPMTADAYERIRELGEYVHEAEPRLRRVVVEQPYPEDPEWGTLDDAIDIWCPLFGFIDEENIRRVQESGDEVWTYTALVQSVPAYHPDYETVKNDLPPFWQIDFPLLGYRVAPWLNRRYGATGLLYWTTCCWGNPIRNPWDNPTLGDHWNGEGILFYPGSDVGIEGPIGCIRLKNLRDGMEDYEYFVLLEERGGGDLVKEIVRDAVPTWGTWDQNPSRLEDRRRRLAEAILARPE